MRTKYNVLLLMTDQQRFDAMRCAGNEEILTPNLDALAESGIRFRCAMTPSPLCVPARMSLITGQRGSVTRFVDNKVPKHAPELPTLMTLLHEAGYRNHAVGKMHFFGRHYGFHRIESQEGLPESVIDDDYLMYLRSNGVRTRHHHGDPDLLYFQPQTLTTPFEHSPSEWVKNRSIQFLQDHVKYRGDKPFFLWSSWFAPHPPFAACEPYASMYIPQQLGLPVNADRPIEDLPAPSWRDRGRLDGAHTDPDRIRRIRALYYAQITHVDDCVGALLGELERLGLEDNTVVIFTSDHGEMLGNQGLSQKSVPYESSVRVPLLIRWPGKTVPGSVSDELVGLTDLLPTLLDGLGLEYPEGHPPLTGQNLLQERSGAAKLGREHYVMDYGNGFNRWICVRSARYKYAMWAAGGHEELYDLLQDPHECRNLAAEQPDLAAQYREIALAWEKEHGMPNSFADGK
ncbi:MAG: sulfatase, partial [Paenibacillaceae bacterium]|nr:sulfatase [Paenibacillaceae bacterium]